MGKYRSGGERSAAASDDEDQDQGPIAEKERKGAASSTGFDGLKAGKSMLKGRRTIPTDENIDFNLVVHVARKHNLNVDEVHEKMKEFLTFDTECQGWLSMEMFEATIRKVCNVRPESPTPQHLFHQHWQSVDQDNDGKVSFEEYLMWTMEVAYSEEVLVPDAGQRFLRHLAREHGINITEVERIKNIFDMFDLDKSGNIEEEEFFHVIMKLMNCKNPSDISQKKLKRYWAEADTDGSGEISFEEFLLWYIRIAGGGL